MKRISSLVLPIALISVVVIVVSIYLIDIWSKVESCSMVSGALCLTILLIGVIAFLIGIAYEGYNDCK